MDKYEYKLKTEQMLELMEDGAYNKAAEIADTIDWKRVRNATMLTNVSDIYEKNRDYQKSYEVLNIAYHRAEGSRKIVYRLCTLALKTRNVDEAIDYYDDFIQIAPKDPNQYILRYQILRAQRAPVEQQIEALEEFKKAEYIEEWAYELAKLYQEAGMTAECLEECDDLILWFSEGKYVYQAMELKMQYKPLTPSQQEKYDHRYEKLSSETEEMPDLTQYNKKEEPVEEPVQAAEEVSEPEEQSEEEPQEPTSEAIKPQEPKRKLGSTMKLDEALKSLLHLDLDISGAGAKAVSTDEQDDEEDLQELEGVIEEIESVSDLGLVQELKSEKSQKVIAVDPDLEELIPEPEEEEADVLEEDEADILVEDDEELVPEDVVSEEVVGTSVEQDDDQIEGQISFEDIFAGWGSPAEVSEAEDIVEESADPDIDSDEAEELESVPEEEEAEELESIPEELEAEELESIPEELESVSEELEAEELESIPEELESVSEELEAEELENVPEELESVPEEEEAEELDIIPEAAEELEEESDDIQEELLPDEELEEGTETEQEEVLEPEENRERETDLEIDSAENSEDLIDETENTGVIQAEGSIVLTEEEELSDDVEELIDQSEKEGVMKETKKPVEPILPPDIQRLIDEIEGVIPREDEVRPAERTVSRSRKEEVLENKGAVTEQLRVDEESDLFEDFDDLLDDEYEAYEEDLPEEIQEDLVEEDDLTGWDEEAFDADAAEEYEDIELEEYGEADAEEYEDIEPEEYDEAYAEEYDDAESEEYDEAYAEEYDDAESEEYDVADAEEYADDETEFYDEAYEEEYDEADAEEYAENESEEYDEVDEEAYEYPDDSEAYDGFEAESYDESDAGSFDAFDDDEIDAEAIGRSLEEEFRPMDDAADGLDDREIPDDENDGINFLTATTPLSRKETAKMIATGKTAPLPLDEISDALSMSDTGFIVHARYDLQTQSGVGTRAGLTEEQKKLFSYFVPVRGMSEQLVDVLEQDKNCTNRKGTSRTGNLLIIGNKGNGKTVLAVDVVKAIQKQRNIRQGKVAIVTGDSLNKKKVSDIFAKLYGGALIIEKAGKMNEKTLARLNKAMERDTGELLIVLEDQRKPLDRLLSSNREFRRKFTSRLEVPIFINDELVTFGQTYAQENGYRIDEMGILALYSRIDALQREDHAVTIAEVKELMDEAMSHSQKASAKKLVRRVFGKNTDEADRIILTEKDFNI